jgi:hypothetical protein
MTQALPGVLRPGDVLHRVSGSLPCRRE